ncbi:MAG TPA: hypothetical protein VFU22_02330 [Roseiflexaceae bacterium]|nr:hypothetical protein [Roseiflexaceae bacterium]
MRNRLDTATAPADHPRIAPHLAALASYTLLALLTTWPLLTHFRSGLVGAVGGVDAYQNAWNMWWVARALSRGQSPFWTDLLFYPNGVDLFWQTLGFSQALLAAPVTLTLGPLAAVNATVLASFIIGGYATFLLARRLTSSAPAALLAGAVYAFSPFHLEKVIDGNVEVAAIQWVPCYVFALFLLLERPGWPRALIAGALLLWVSLGSWYYGLFCVLYTGCMIAIWTLGRPRQVAARLALWGVLPVLIWGLVLAPRITTLAAGGDQSLQDMRALQDEHSADLLDFFLPSPVNPWWGPSVRAAHEELYPGAVIWNVALGWTGLLLGGLGAIALRRQSWRWSLLLLAALLLAMGPALRVAGYQTGIPLPFALIRDLPGIRAGQRPNHMVVIASLMLALLAAYGLLWVTRRLDRQAWLVAFGAVAAVLLLDGYAGPLKIVERTPHPFYATLPPPNGALLPLPLYVNVNRSENLTAQMAHGWPIPSGYVARPPSDPFAKYTPGLRELQDGRAAADDIISPGWPESGRAALADYAIRYVVLDLTSQKDEYFAAVRTLLRELGAGPPLVSDSLLEAYAMPNSWPARPIMFLGAGWDKLERQPDTAFRWRWMGAAAEIRLYNPYHQPVTASITLSVSSFETPREVQLALDGAALGRLGAQPSQPTTRLYRLLVPPGEHVLRLTAPDSPDPGRIGRRLSVRVFRLAAEFGELLSR